MGSRVRITLKDGTGVMERKFITEDVDRHGNVRLYVRKRRGKKIRLRETPGTPAFEVEYQAALKRIQDKAPAVERITQGSLKWLVAHYQQSGVWAALEASTQEVKRRILDEVCSTKAQTGGTYGDLAYKGLLPRHIRSMRDDKASVPHAADNRLKTLSAMFKWAVECDLMNANPCRDVQRNRQESDGFHTWTQDELLQYMERHPANTKAGLALALLLWVGVRRSDLVKLGPQMENKDGTLIRFQKTKGKKRKPLMIEVPIEPELRAVLDQHPTPRMTYIQTEYGRAFTPNGFGNKFKDWCVQAGLPHCTAHGVRKGGATLRADAGATDYQLMGLYGWANPKEAAPYTKKANRKRLAAEASKLLKIRK